MSKRTSLQILKLRWRDQLFRDCWRQGSRLRVLTPSTFKVGYAMADFVTMENTKAEYERVGRIFIFPSIETLKERTHLDPDTIRLAIKQLIKRKHLKRISRGNQVSGSAVYEVLVHA